MGEYIVYVHTTPDGKKYVGMTKCTTTQRWKNGAGYKDNERFYDAIQKYGWRNILHEIIAENLTEEQARQTEKEYIEKFGSYGENGYNVQGGEGKAKWINIRCSEEEREEVNEIAKRHKMSVARFIRWLIEKQRKEDEGNGVQ